MRFIFVLITALFLTGNSQAETITDKHNNRTFKIENIEGWKFLINVEILKSENWPVAKRIISNQLRLYEKAYASDEVAGKVSAKWAAETGLAEGTLLAVGAFDAHLGAVGAGIGEGTLVKIMGTSTCDLMISSQDAVVKGVCGTVQDSVIPGYTGIEAGQSAVGDLFLWLVNNLVPDTYGKDLNEKFINLTTEADKLTIAAIPS